MTGHLLRRLAATLLAGAVLSPVALAGPADLSTHAERTGFRETGRYEEVERLCTAFAER